MKRQEFKGEITVFLSLVFVLLLSFIGVMIQSASIHITKSMKRADTRLALESVFAEYQPDMLREYGLFVRADGNEHVFSERLGFYGAGNMTHEIQKLQLLTDYNGQAFYEQAVCSVGGKIEREEIQEREPYLEAKDTKGKEYGWEINERLEKLLEEKEQSLPLENNPIETVKSLKKSGLLDLVIPDSKLLSDRSVALEKLPSHRTLQTGTESGVGSPKDRMIQRFQFVRYLTKQFPDYTKERTGKGLLYETEYLLTGLGSDRENLEAVLKKILTIRTGMNYVYLLTDQTKQAEAESMALALCSLILLPEITEVVKQAILLAWAYGEGIQDLRILAEGKEAPLVKTQENWQLSLGNLTKLGTDEDVRPGEGVENGIHYSGYLTTFLQGERWEKLSMRALDLIELKLGIRTDTCVVGVQIKSTCKMQRGIQDTFFTEYYYQ